MACKMGDWTLEEFMKDRLLVFHCYYSPLSLRASVLVTGNFLDPNQLCGPIAPAASRHNERNGMEV